MRRHESKRRTTPGATQRVDHLQSRCVHGRHESAYKAHRQGQEGGGEEDARRDIEFKRRFRKGGPVGRAGSHPVEEHAEGAA